ncbi:Na/Pi cotransporter family protein [Metabacillus litoralis]|uniref:Na/Pi cotransporter family protein n=1 Tax=Metabacillus litoralis TaxID=152268 RepID=UPI001B945C8A|nr:Na/Pi cotransporter family protein [Metabacillus litoralis]MCM3160681.1 Na/Pi cotransporter family protein [Metabacillus litoralis]MCM3413146.1 Na/Pi cotransporter family protein [Metabacillus litoralis]UHA60057.1 Na/Pi cotransporter family protein [Metabacillus litoralis]
MEINYQEMLFQFLGGLGIFLFGIKYMGDGLQSAAGDRLKDILDRFTTNPFMGVLAGLLVTVLIQSSSGTTALTVGLVSAGFMTLRQAIGVIMGANIGTTVTAFIIGIDVGAYALPIIALGAFCIFFFKKKGITSFGQVAFGFGALFFGLELMSGGMKPLRSLEAFHDLTVSMASNPILGVLVGTIFTVIVQSSSATIGILQELFSQDAISLNAALPVLFGDNIGTTITAVLASLGASIAARRAAFVHVLFNLIGTVIFLILLIPFTYLITYLQDTLSLNPAMTIAFAHGTFNISNTIIQFPFIFALAWLVTKLIPGEDKYIDTKPQHLNPTLIEHSPSIALGQAKEELKRMGEFTVNGLGEAFQYLNLGEKKHAENALQYETGINNLDKKITSYLLEISAKPLSVKERDEFSNIADSIRDMERIGDHMENIVELVDFKINKKVNLSNDATNELKEMYEFTLVTLETAYSAFFENDVEKAKEVLSRENEIDKMERVLRKKHIMRLNERQCSGDAGIVFVDIISNLERIADHSVNIAETILTVESN